MLEKMIKVMMLWFVACVVIIGSAMKTADANDVYLYTRDDIEYYATSASKLTNPDLPDGFFVRMVGVKNGETVDRMTYLFIHEGNPYYALDGNPYYTLVNGNDGFRSNLDAVNALYRGSYRERGHVADNSYASMVYYHYAR